MSKIIEFIRAEAAAAVHGPSTDPVRYSLDGLPHVEYGVDGFTSTGITVIAGEIGLGKTSAIVPIAATVAHLIKVEDDLFTLNPKLRRKIVYVTEDVNQVQRLLYGLKRNRSECTEEEFQEWFTIIEAGRRKPAELAIIIAEWRGLYSYQAGDELNHYMVEPLIIIDTASSNIDLENENDNAEVGRAISFIKSELGSRGMVWLVTHIAKALRRADVADMTVRGAGAWMGDANATAYLVSDESLKDSRFLILGKRRFETSLTEIEITSELNTELTKTPWGETQTQTYRTCDLRGLSSRNGMKQQAAKARSSEIEKEITLVLKEAYSGLGEKADWKGLTGGAIEKKVTGKAVSIREALKRLSQERKIESITEGSHNTAPTFYWLKGQVRRGLND